MQPDARPEEKNQNVEPKVNQLNSSSLNDSSSATQPPIVIAPESAQPPDLVSTMTVQPPASTTAANTTVSQPPGVITPPIRPVSQNVTDTPSPPRRRFTRKRVIIGMVSVVLIGSIALILLLATSGSGPLGSIFTPNKITRAYDSPIGLLPPFQKEKVKNGRFKLTASYLGESEISREGTFFVADDGSVSFEMLPDINKVNGLIKYLYTKEGVGAVYDESKMGATRNFKYDFQSLLGYKYLYSRSPAFFGGFITAIDLSKSTPTSAEEQLYTPGPSCDSALAEVKTHTTSKLNTLDLKTKVDAANGRTSVSVDEEVLAGVDTSVKNFFKSCYDFTKPSIVEYEDFIKKLEAEPTKSPSIAYWQENDRWHMEVGNGNTSSALGHRVFKFEIWDINTSNKSMEGDSASFSERSNLYGLAYSHCRAVPVVTSDFMAGYSYNFIAEDVLYNYPSEFDSGYYCSTLEVPPNYRPNLLTLEFKEGVKVSMTEAEIINQRVQHDLAYQIERFNLEKGRYPNPDEVKLLAADMGELADTANKLLSSKKIELRLLPEGCREDCKQYELAYKITDNVTSIKKAYSPE